MPTMECKRARNGKNGEQSHISKYSTVDLSSKGQGVCTFYICRYEFHIFVSPRSHMIKLFQLLYFLL